MNIPSKKISEMTADMIRAGALKCPIKLGHGKGPVKVPAESGDWYAHPAKTEVTRKYRKSCIEDLRQRQLRGGSYPGDFGHCTIGGKRFTLYPHSGMLVRDDFGQWAEKHFHEFWDIANHRERLPNEPQGEAVTVDPALKIWKEIRKRALSLPEPTGILHEGSFNSLFDMKKGLAEYTLEMQKDRALGRSYIGTKTLADQLAAVISHRECNNSAAVDHYMDCAASCLRAILWIEAKYGTAKEDSK